MSETDRQSGSWSRTLFVSGGNTANALAIWRLHGIDKLLREAWERGIVLSGVSAGAICWFDDGVTDSFGPQLEPLGDGLGFLAGSCCPHYDGEPRRRPRYAELLGSGALPSGIALDDGVAARFKSSALFEVVSSRPTAGAWQVDQHRTHKPLPVRRLP